LNIREGGNIIKVAHVPCSWDVIEDVEAVRKETILIRVANAPCSWGVIENVAGEREGYAWVLD
jgi:hypothetical protein